MVPWGATGILEVPRGSAVVGEMLDQLVNCVRGERSERGGVGSSWGEPTQQGKG